MAIKPIEVAEIVEKQLNDLYDFSPKKAHIYGVTLNPDTGEISLGETHELGDVYDLLASRKARTLAKKSDFVAVLTCGWASPVSDDETDEIAPSQHPKRRRVRLVVVASRKGVASVLRFQDQPDDTVTDEGKARGSLADAVTELFRD